MEIRVDSNIKEFTKWLNTVQREQVPFATSRAINDVAVDGQSSIVKHITGTFKNIKRWWLKQQPTGVKVRFSNKRDLHARVFTDVYFSQRQQDGGVKAPKQSKNLAIPLPAVPRKYRTSSGARDMLRADNKTFSVKGKGIFKRKGKKRYPITPLFTYAPSSRTKPALKFDLIIEKVVRRRFAQHFKKRLDAALASAKPPSL